MNIDPNDTATTPGPAGAPWLQLHGSRHFLDWLRVVYDFYGRSVPKETELQDLNFYKDSRPVRIGRRWGQWSHSAVYFSLPIMTTIASAS